MQPQEREALREALTHWRHQTNARFGLSMSELMRRSEFHTAVVNGHAEHARARVVLQ